jgi:hypothetical protein
MTRIRLQQDDFIALRSLSKGMWRQGDMFDWKFNRTWRLASFGDVPALDAADRLVAMGLVEDTVCCAGCRRPSFKLTTRGIAMVGRINSRPRVEVDEKASAAAVPARGIVSQLRALLGF